MNDLFELPNLKNILGYNDIRTVRNWCRKNNVPIIILGRKSYVHRESIDNIVERQLSGCINTKDASQSVIEAIRKDESPIQRKDIKPFHSAPKHKEIKSAKNKHSKAANQLLHALNSAK